MTADDNSAGTTAPPPQQDAPAPGVLRIYPPTDGPHASAMVECSTAFHHGAIGRARRLAGAVRTDASATEAERAFADEILARTAIDPVALVVGIGCFCLFWFTIYWYVWR